MHFTSFPDFPSPAWATSPASLASSVSLAGADADDAGDAGDVAQEMLRMQKQTWGESNTSLFLRNCVPGFHGTSWNRNSLKPWLGVRGVTGTEEHASVVGGLVVLW